MGKVLPKGKATCRPYLASYRPELDETPYLDDEKVNYYQQLIGVLRWGVELTRIDIALEVSLLSSFLVAPREGHLQAVYNIFGYLDKHMESNLVFDDKVPDISEEVFQDTNWKDTIYGDIEEELPPNMPKPLGNNVVTSCFVDANHAGDLVTRRSHTGVIIYVNNAPITWLSKK